MLGFWVGSDAPCGIFCRLEWKQPCRSRGRSLNDSAPDDGTVAADKRRLLVENFGGSFWMDANTSRESQTKLSEAKCPTCGLDLNGESNVAGVRNPTATDVSICRECAEILVLSRDSDRLTIRPTTASEYLSLSEDKRMILQVAYEIVTSQARQRYN